MKQNWLIVLLVGVLLLTGFPNGVTAAQPISITLDGEELDFDVAPVLESGRVLVPVRVIFEAFGATVDWDTATNTITARRDNDTIKLTIGNKTAHKNGEAVELDVPAKIIRGRTLVPVRFVSEALGAKVLWDSKNQVVSIHQRNELELQAIEQVKKYLSMLDKAVGGGLEDEEWESILSEAAIKSGYGIDARVFKPMSGQMGSSGRSIQDIAIVDSKTLSIGPNITTIMVTARYIYYDPTSPFVARTRLQYEKNYYLIKEQGDMVLDREETVKETPVK
ncbi:hypothetical protein SY88_03350 [Clostridiales bacterium PH28_bin88]|nr:hypothetical protein SY88_03350 [Clostridiales bacterium PH28_bin88]